MRPESTIQWTAQQLAGITTAGHSVLVSAAAGSGKTAVLAERCAYLVCDANEPCDIDQLLVVTFTESAAAEMKNRIQAALRRKMAARPSPRLACQIDFAQHAHVGTIHGFCARLLRQNFTLAQLDPEFQILDPDEAMLLRRDIAGELFELRYETDESGDFHRLIDAYGDGNDQALIERVVSAQELLCSLVDPQAWIEKTAAIVRQTGETPLEKSELGRALIGQIADGLASLVRKGRDVKHSLRELGADFAPYVKNLDEVMPFFPHFQDVLSRHGLDMLVSEVSDFRGHKPRAPAVRGQPANKDLAKSLLDSVKDALDKGPLADLLGFTSDQWKDGMARVAPHAQTFLSLVRDFGSAYSAAKDADRALDFADLERRSLRILSAAGPGDSPRPSPLAKSLHQRFRHVLVDEYQDINPIQDAILELVSRECIGERDANLFCVGDVKQSIFGFRLAEPGRFLRRLERFSAAADMRNGEVIYLRENFRSRPPLLEAINGVFERLLTRQAAEIEYDQSHRLAAGRSFPPAGPGCFAGSPIELHLLPEEPGQNATDHAPAEELDRVEYEAIAAARRIRQIMGMDGSPPMNVCATDPDDKTFLRPIEFGDIAVLLRAMHFKADPLADALRAHGIPVYREGGSGFFEATEVRDIICLLKILDNQRQDIPLAAVLRSPLSGLPNADDAMARIRLAFVDQTNPVAFHEAVRKYAEEKDDELAAFLRDFLNRLGEWRDQAAKYPVAEFLWRLYDETGYLAFCGGLEDGKQRVANLLYLHERAAQFGSFLRQGLYRFLRFLENLQEQTDISRPSPPGQAEKAVRIMSIHRAKGLEFPVVVLPDLGKEHNLSDANRTILVDRQGGLGMSVVDEQRLIRYPSLASTLVRMGLVRQTIAEELRLLYVAMTRAKEHLILLATCSETDCQRWKSQWTGRAGPLPADAVQSASRVIDWLGPVAAMTALSKSPSFDVHEYAAADVMTWKNPYHQRPAFSQEQRCLARLQPLKIDPPMTDAARQLIERFETAYPFERFCAMQAAASVTSLAKELAVETADAAGPSQRKLDLPRFFAQEQEPKPTDIGNATHTVLQYFDFSSAPEPDRIERQIDSLVQRKMLAQAQARLVDRGAIAWFLDSDVGKLIRANHARVIRELPFALAQKPADGNPADPLDQIMIRGRLDLLVPTPAGMGIVDYKTDRVAGADLPRRAETYIRQMRYYAEAIRAIARQPVAAIHLVFLHAREIVSVAGS